MRRDCIVVEEPIGRLSDYARVPISFEVGSIIDVIGDDPATAVLDERSVDRPWTKDYDLIKGEGPTRWAKRWDISSWGVLAAYEGNRRVGGCVLAHNTDGVNKLEGRNDLVAMWDLRVRPECRGNGIGFRLFEAAIQWAKDRQCVEMKIETQNINVPACRFYRRQGCKLCSINRHAYEESPEEVELIWSFDLRP